MEADLAPLKRAIESRLAEVLPDPDAGPLRLTEAMRYSLLAPAKRVRPLLALFAAEQLGADPLRALDVGIAVELVHAASLVLDDLPAMDDAEERRGRPANHKIWGEDTAMLAAIALLNQAFGVIAASPLRDVDRVRAVAVLASSIGPDGLTGGQEFDLRANDAEAPQPDDVERTHRLKTAVLFAAAAELGGIAAGGDPAACAALRRFGTRLGLAFQGLDDLLDAHAAASVIGKDVGKDVGKPTLVGLLGRERAEERARAHVRAALGELETTGGAHKRLGRFATGLVESLERRLVPTT